jgi:hypothetical protein
MPSIVTKCAIVAALFTLTSAVASAADKPPRYLNEPVLGLRLDASAKLDPLPEDVRALCVQIADNEYSTARMWIFAQASDAGAAYYVVGGYSKLRHPDPGEHQYEPTTHGGLMSVTGNTCAGDPADEAMHAPSDEVPLSILKQLARDLATRLVRAVGGADKLRAEIKNQRIDFDRLSPELQEAFKPYFGQDTAPSRK